MSKGYTTNPTKLPGLPNPPAGIDPQLYRYLDSVREILDIRTGRRGDPRDRAVTLRELIDSGLAEELKARPFDPNAIDPGNIGFGFPEEPPVLTVPPQPTGFSASGGYENAMLFWDFPYYQNHSLTEIWRHTSDVLGDAVLIGTSSGTSYIDPIGPSATYYYWIRHISTGGIPGPWYSASGAVVTTPATTALLLSELAGAITHSELTGTLSSQINDNTTDIVSIEGQYAVKINANGRVAGFGLINTASLYDSGTHSEFTVLADQFNIVNYTDDGDIITPFIVVTSPTTINGVSVPVGTYIDAAYIENGTITTAKIGNAMIDTAKIANLAVSEAKLDNASVATAKIQDLAVSTAKIAAAAITNAKIGAAAVGTANIQNAAIVTALIDDLTVTSLKIANEAVTIPTDTFVLGTTSNVKQSVGNPPTGSALSPGDTITHSITVETFVANTPLNFVMKFVSQTGSVAGGAAFLYATFTEHPSGGSESIVTDVMPERTVIQYIDKANYDEVRSLTFYHTIASAGIYTYRFRMSVNDSTVVQASHREIYTLITRGK